MSLLTKLHTNTCYHCGEAAGSQPMQFDNKWFCCSGCKTVYQILNKNGLCEYYNFDATPGKSQRATVRPEKFAFLEDTSIRQQLIKFNDGRQSQVTFYLPQMHCSSCLWLLEHLHHLNQGVFSSRVDFAHKDVTIRFDEKSISLRQLAELLTSVGYEPYISLNELNEKPKKYYNRNRIYKLGVAGFCLGNIMLLSFPEYLSLVDNPEQLKLTPWFRYLNLLLAIPVFFYSAQEFFVQGYKGLRGGFLNIDAPIALAILITFVRSVIEIIANTGGGYLDSMAGIVFFMLVGRAMQDHTNQALTFDRDYTSYFPIAINRLVSGQEVPTALPQLRTGDTIIIHHQEIIPADGILVRGVASIDYSFVTGESIPVEKGMSELIYAGGRQVGGKIELLLVKDVSQSYLTSLWNKASANNDSDRDSFVHPLARYFTVILFSLTAVAGIYWWINDAGKVWPVITAMLIVACPCALLLSATFTNGHVVRAFDRAGMYLRNYGILEKLLPVTHVVFDKTGTITTNQQFEIKYFGEELSLAQRSLVGTVAAQSQHPLSKVVAKWLDADEGVFISNFKETIGKGIEAWIDDRHIVVGSPEFVNGYNYIKEKGSVVAFRIDKATQGFFLLKNNYRAGLAEALASLGKRYHISVISGDNDAERETLEAYTRGKATLRFEQSPHDKLAYIKSLQQQGAKVLMIGDGLNDAAALQQSEVGLAVSDNVNNFSPACDAILEAGQLRYLARFLKMARVGRHIIIASFVLSILYNIVGLTFAASGHLTPLVAAILMPASSISIILFTWACVLFSSSTLPAPAIK